MSPASRISAFLDRIDNLSPTKQLLVSLGWVGTLATVGFFAFEKLSEVYPRTGYVSAPILPDSAYATNLGNDLLLVTVMLLAFAMTAAPRSGRC